MVGEMVTIWRHRGREVIEFVVGEEAFSQRFKRTPVSRGRGESEEKKRKDDEKGQGKKWKKKQERNLWGN